jgi:hypothetical protein
MPSFTLDCRNQFDGSTVNRNFSSEYIYSGLASSIKEFLTSTTSSDIKYLTEILLQSSQELQIVKTFKMCYYYQLSTLCSTCRHAYKTSKTTDTCNNLPPMALWGECDAGVMQVELEEEGGECNECRLKREELERLATIQEE